MTEFNRAIAGPDASGDTTLAEMFMRVGLLVQERDELAEANAAIAQRLSAAEALLLVPNKRRASCVWCGWRLDDHAEDCDIEVFLASPDAVVQARADAVRAAYEALDAAETRLSPNMTDQTCGDSLGPDHRCGECDGCLSRFVWQRCVGALSTLREAFPELQS